MKKKILIIMLLLIIFIKGVNAACNLPEEDTTPGNSKVLTCDSKNTKTTKFQYPTTGDPLVETFNNGYCVVKCREEIMFGYPGIRRTYAGMPFSYTLLMAGQRSCTATYIDYVKFDEKYRTLVNMYMVLLGQTTTGRTKADINNDGLYNIEDYNYVRNQASTFVDMDGKKVLDLDNNNVMDSDSVALGSLSNAIRNMKQKKDDCDGWGTTANPSSIYEVKPSVNLTISTSKGDVTETYEYEEISPYNSIMTYDNTTYSSCVLSSRLVNGSTEYTCNNDYTYIGWTEIARVNGWFIMGEKKMTIYEGKTMPIAEFVEPDVKTCWAGRSYYVPLAEVSKPNPANTTDNGYPMRLSVTNLGNNISSVPKDMNLTVNCWYQVRNLIGPTESDWIYDEYSEQIPAGARNSISLYLYRPIDLKDPFPNNREPGANWVGTIEEMINGKKVTSSLKERYITNEASTIQTKTLYKIKLNRSNINSIKRSNAQEGYNLFKDVEVGPNEFIRKYYEVISPRG